MSDYKRHGPALADADDVRVFGPCFGSFANDVLLFGFSGVRCSSVRVFASTQAQQKCSAQRQSWQRSIQSHRKWQIRMLDEDLKLGSPFGVEDFAYKEASVCQDCILTCIAAALATLP